MAIAARVVATAATLTFLWLLAHAIDAVFNGSTAPGDMGREFALLGIALLARAAAMWTSSICIGHAGDSVQHELRNLGVRASLNPSPQDVGETTGVLLDGVADIRAWVVDYLPVAAMAVIGPVMAIGAVALLDPLTSLVLLFTGPMLALLLVVIGRRTAELTRRRADELGWLRSFYLDLLEGLPTLKLFGAGRDGAALVEDTSRRFGDTTMQVLRTAFQTSLVMEWAATAATALAAVEVSIRMTTGELDFATALAVLMLVPEFFVPFRHLALAYHAGSSGDAASQRVRDLLGGREPMTGSSDGPRTQPNEPVASIERPAGSTGLHIEFRNVSFSYPGRTRAAIEGLDLDIEAGETVALCGPSGAGKSTVLSLLLGFTRPDGGTILANGVPVNSAVVSSAAVSSAAVSSAAVSSAAVKDAGHPLTTPASVSQWRRLVSWVPQHPTLFSGTVAENIAFGDPQASMRQIRRAARTAGIIDFVESLPDGFETVLGEGGHNLSGGQRQRIAIARAHLRDAPLVLLDEFTSHVDPQVESAVLDATEHLLRDRTAVVIAHRRSTAQHADRVVFLESGSVVDCGPATEVLERHRSWDPSLHVPAPLHDSPSPQVHPASSEPPARRLADHRNLFDADLQRRRPHPRRLMRMLHGHRGWVVVASALSAATIASGIGLMAVAAWLISRAAELDSTATLALGITAVRLFAVSRVALRYAERLVGHVGTFRWVTTLRVRFFNALEPLTPLRNVGDHRGDLLARVLVDIDAVGDFPLRVVVPFTAAGVVLVGSVILLAGFSVPAGVLTGTALVVLGVGLPRFTRRATRSLSVEAAAVRGRLEGALVESLAARIEVVAWGRQDRLTTATESASERLGSIHRARTRALANADAAGIVISGAATLGAFAFAAVAVEHGTLAAVMLAGVPLITLSAFEAVLPLPAAAEDATRASASAARLDAFTENTWSTAATGNTAATGYAETGHAPAVGGDIAHNDPTGHRVLPRPAPGTPAMELSDVWFSHRTGRLGDMPVPVLKGLNLAVQQGSIAIIGGPSGAGKSTVVDLLCGFSSPRSGTVRVMGVDIASASRPTISELVTVVLQDDHLFDTTVRDNLALASPDASDDEMLDALRSADANRFVLRAPGGLNYRIGPNGENLSGGERQRLMIARALLRNAPLLVLDEATTHLDRRAEAAVVDGIVQWRAAASTTGVPRRTVVFIAHHPPEGLVPDVSYEIRHHGASGTPAREPDCPSGCR